MPKLFRTLSLPPAAKIFGLAGIVLSALIAASPQTASSYELAGEVWPLMPVTYCVNTARIPTGDSGRPIVSPDKFVELVQAAFQKWEDLPDSDISFIYSGLCDANPLNPKADGVNAVGWGRIPVFDGGVTIRRPSKEKTQRDGKYREIMEADIAVNTFSIATDSDPVQFVSTSLPPILLHEVGHFIGLNHSNAPCSVMRPFPNVDFCQDDWDAATALYPAKPK